jgi:hypothetical protein
MNAPAFGGATAVTIIATADTTSDLNIHFPRHADVNYVVEKLPANSKPPISDPSLALYGGVR